MFKINKVSFMPSIRAAYGELGAENYFDMFFRIQDMPPFSVYYRTGGNKFDRITGGGFEMRKIARGRFSFAGQLDYWRNGREETNNYNAYLKGGYSIPSTNFRATYSVGYKSRGALMGKPLDKGFYAYVGVGLNLSYAR